MSEIYHIWYKGEREQSGEYIYREDTCPCGCVRRTVLNDKNKEEIEHYSIGEDIFLYEPICTRRKPIRKPRPKKIKANANNRRVKRDKKKS